MSTGADAFLLEHGFLTDGIDREKLIDAFDGEIDRALQGGKSSLQMLPSSLSASGRIRTDTPTLVVDAGGTNLRVGAVTIPSDGSAPRFEHVVRLPMPGTHGRVSADEFHGAIAAALDGVAAKVPRADRLGYCFSYGCESNADHDAKLLAWSKQVEAPEVVGQYVGAELVRRLSHPVGHVAVLNDTVATLLAGKAMYPFASDAAYLGFILGTGTNTAYVEKNANITKLAGLDPNGTMIINAESGGFNKVPMSAFDKANDLKTGNPGFNFLEKMIAGAFLGGIGLEIYKQAAKAGMFSAKAASAIGGLGSLETMDFDNFCASFRKEGRVNPLDEIFADADDAKMARRLGIPVFERAAVLTAIHLAAFCIKSGEGADPSAPIAINADGSTYYKTRAIPFADTVKKELDDMLVKRRNIHYCITPQVEDAPMVGAGIAAML